MRKKVLVALGLILSVGLILGIVLVLRPEPELASEINLFFWGNRMPSEVIEKFEKEFDVKVNFHDFGSESNMVDALKWKRGDYDVVGVTELHIRELIEAGLVAPMTEKNVLNVRDIGERCSGASYNEEELYMAPVVWVTSGIVFNTKYVPEDTDSWEVLWNPEYAKKIAMQDNRNGVFMVALRYIGYPVLAQSRFQLLEAKNFLFNQRPLLRGYENQLVIMQSLVSEELWAAHLSSSPAKAALSKNPNLKYVVPKEGSLIAPVGFAIPISSRKKYTAEVFINYLLDPEVSAIIAENGFAATCSEAAEEFLDKEFLEDEAIYPPEETFKNVESLAQYEVKREIISDMEDIWLELNEEASR